MYINYIFDRKLFSDKDETNQPLNANTLRFKTTWEAGKSFAEQNWSNDLLTLNPPRVLSGGCGDANWNWESLNGESVSSINESGIPQNDTTALSAKAYDRMETSLQFRMMIVIRRTWMRR